MAGPVPLHAWGDRLEALCASLPGSIETVRVVAEIDSTQDLARSCGAGTLVTTGRQRAGRGQRGNEWADTGEHGLAFSICLAATDRPEQSLVLAQALSEALGSLLPGRIVVKPPNDLMVDGRKLAGVLIEQAEALAVIGVGINVGRCCWSDELMGHAISLAEAGVEIDRLQVLEQVLPAVIGAWTGS